jgi:hypothetical protein
VIFEALSYAEHAGSAINKQIGDYESVFDKIEK